MAPNLLTAPAPQQGALFSNFPQQKAVSHPSNGSTTRRPAEDYGWMFDLPRPILARMECCTEHSIVSRVERHLVLGLGYRGIRKDSPRQYRVTKDPIETMNREPGGRAENGLRERAAEKAVEVPRALVKKHGESKSCCVIFTESYPSKFP